MSGAQEAARQVVLALARAGVQEVVLAPGSRNAPLGYALLAAERAGTLTLHVRVDERSAGFVAIGLARATGRPAAVVVTSGTAVANLHPAVLEAGHARVPLVVVSADRPGELRGTGANQTTLHPGIFGVGDDVSRPRAHVDLGAWDDGARWDGVGGPEGWVDALDAALASATGDVPGAVHVNVAFREPLMPDGAWDVPEARPARAPSAAHASAPAAPTGSASPVRVVVVAGDGAGADARLFAEATGAPLLAEPSSGARAGDRAVTAGARLLGLDGLGGAIERVAVFGRPTLTRPVTQLLARCDLDVVVADPPGAAWVSPPGARHIAAGDLAADVVAPAWARAWQAASHAVDAELDAWCGEATAAGRLDGVAISRELARIVGEEGSLLLAGSSMAVRHLDLAARPWAADASARLLANRGLAGIDGTVSTAVGLALGSRAPVRVLLGDLTYLHDATGLAVGALERDVDLDVIVLADGGGAIFATLEQGAPEHSEGFERLFGTPQRIDIAALAAGAQAEHVLVRTPQEWAQAARRAPSGRRVVEVRLDRAGARERGAALEERLVAAARRALAG